MALCPARTSGADEQSQGCPFLVFDHVDCASARCTGLGRACDCAGHDDVFIWLASSAGVVLFNRGRHARLSPRLPRHSGRDGDGVCFAGRADDRELIVSSQFPIRCDNGT